MGPPPGPSLVTGLPSCFTLQELDYWCYCEGLLAAHTQGWEQDPDPESYTIQLCICPFVWCKQNAPRCPGSVCSQDCPPPIFTSKGYESISGTGV